MWYVKLEKLYIMQYCQEERNKMEVVRNCPGVQAVAKSCRNLYISLQGTDFQQVYYIFKNNMKTSKLYALLEWEECH